MSEPVYQLWLDRDAVDAHLEAVDLNALSYDDCEARYLLDGKPFTGFARQRSNGVLRSIYRLADGIEHGVAVAWHTNGQIRSYAETAGNVWHGLVIEWDEEGRIVRADRYDEGLLVGPVEPTPVTGPVGESASDR